MHDRDKGCVQGLQDGSKEAAGDTLLVRVELLRIAEFWMRSLQLDAVCAQEVLLAFFESGGRGAPGILEVQIAAVRRSSA